VTHAMTLPEHVARTIVPDPLDSCRAIAALALGVSPTGNAVELVARLAEAYCQLKAREGERPPSPPPGRTLAQVTDDAMRDALYRHRGDFRKAAKELGIHHRTLERQLGWVGWPVRAREGARREGGR
jgi:DNA-binding NtrC family response regulator